jgi:hypothetical protein
MPRDESEREEAERWIQAEREANLIESGDFVCAWCQRCVDPSTWWTHVEAHPYEDMYGFGPTLFHRGCAASTPEKNWAWVKSLRKLYGESPIQPGDYVQLTSPRYSGLETQMPFRVIGIETDEYVGVTLDSPYYVLDTSEPGRRYQSSYQAQKREFEVVGRPYLKS